MERATGAYSALERIFAIPELLDIIVSFLTPADLPDVAEWIVLSSTMRNSILRRLHMEETTLFRVACAACRRQCQLPLLVKTCRAVEYLRPQSPRTGYGTASRRVGVPQSRPFQRYDFIFDWTHPANFARSANDPDRKGDRLVCDPELYLDKSLGNHQLPTSDGGYRLVSLPIKQLVHALTNIAQHNGNQEAMCFLLAKYSAFFAPGHARRALGPILEKFIRADNIVSLEALIDACPTLLSMTFSNPYDTLLRRVTCHRLCPSGVVEMLVVKGVSLHPPLKSSADLLPLEQVISTSFPLRTITMLVEHGATVRWSVLKQLAGPDGTDLGPGVENAVLPALDGCAEAGLEDTDTSRSKFSKRLRKAIRSREVGR